MEIHHRGHHREHHEYFIQITDRDVAHIRAGQIGFTPADTQAGRAHHTGDPGHGCANLATEGGANRQLEVVSQGSHKEGRAHPHDGGLT